MSDEELKLVIEKLKEKAIGNVVETVIENYKTNENGDTIIDNKTIKKIKNDIDTQACIKLIEIELKRREFEKNDTFDNLSDEELQAEKMRLLKELAQNI